jgi:uncharacterized protein (TIGR02594 family)
MTATPWLDHARSDLGVKEIKGKKHHPRILEMLREVGHPDVQNDEDSWCAVAQGSWLVRSGLPTSKPVKLNRTGLSYEDYGTPCEPKPGAISVSTYTAAGRKDWRRHVGTITKVFPTYFMVIGGNQSDKVCETKIMRSRVTAVRWPPMVAVPEPLQEPQSMGKTIAESPTSQLGIGGMIMLVFGYILDGFSYVFNGLVGLLDHAPTSINDVSPVMSQSEQLAGWTGIPWDKLSAVVVALLLLAMVVRHARDRRWLSKSPNPKPVPAPAPEGGAA